MVISKNQEARKVRSILREEIRKAFRAGRRSRISAKRAFLDSI